MNAELRFLAMRSQQQPALPPTTFLIEFDLHPVTVEFEPFGAASAVAFDYDRIALQRNAFEVPGALSHIAEREEDHHYVQACKWKNQPGAVKCEPQRNREDHHRKRAQNEEPAGWRERIIAPCNKREPRRTLHRFFVHVQFMLHPALARPRHAPQDTNPLLFSAAIVAQAPCHGKKTPAPNPELEIAPRPKHQPRENPVASKFRSIAARAWASSGAKGTTPMSGATSRCLSVWRFSSKNGMCGSIRLATHPANGRPRCRTACAVSRA